MTVIDFYFRACLSACQAIMGRLLKKSLYVMLCMPLLPFLMLPKCNNTNEQHNVLPIHTDVNVTLFRSSTCSLNEQPIEIEASLREFYELTSVNTFSVECRKCKRLVTVETVIEL